VSTSVSYLGNSNESNLGELTGTNHLDENCLSDQVFIYPFPVKTGKRQGRE
jgi:hypothetical protein